MTVEASKPISAKTTVSRAALPLSTGQRVLLVATNYIPFLHATATGTLAAAAAAGWMRPAAGSLALIWLLLAPPLVVRATTWLRPLSEGDIAPNSSTFMLWWFVAQWQVIFNRLPWIEECIRLVPGLYSAWLRLWGARVGKFVYWTPGLRILDRQLVHVGDRVIFGAGVRVNPHVIMPDEGGRPVLRVGTVRIGNDVLVGGYSLLTAGCWIADGEATPGKRDHRPFTGWANGRRVEADAPAAGGDGA